MKERTEGRWKKELDEKKEKCNELFYNRSQKIMGLFSIVDEHSEVRRKNFVV